MTEVTLIRYDEIGLKGGNRRFFEGRLRANIARALGVPLAAVTRERGRLYLELPGEAPAGGAESRALARVFGVRSFSPARRVDADLASLTDAVVELAGAADARGAATFAMDSRRSEKAYPLTSIALNVALGRAVQDRYPGLAVDLGQPDVTLHVEVRSGGAYVYDVVLPGPGGLPVGTSGRALLLLSGGIDSPVAGWMAMKRGIAMDAVHFHSAPYTGPGAREKAVALARELAGWRGRPLRLHVISLTAAQQAIGRFVPERLWTLALRRMMVRVAEAVARRDGQGALVTGDSVGQVASQTLENLREVDAAVGISVLRPLVGFDKTEIIERARRIGTYALSVQPFDDCCTVFAPRHPETRARPGELAAAETALPWAELVDQALASAEAVTLDPRPARRTAGAERFAARGTSG